MTKKNRKKNRSLNRKRNRLEEYEKVLIVCEDSVSSPEYFKDLIRSEKLSSVNISITGDCGSDPISVVNEAISEYKKSITDKNPASDFDRVFCVVDRDNHPTFNQAINKISSHKNNGIPIYWVPSFPSFEYWYLCHFKFTRQFIQKNGRKSAGDECVSILNKEWQRVFSCKYTKNQTQIYTKLNCYLETAIKNAGSSLTAAEKTNEMNPSTKVQKLVEYLLNLRNTDFKLEKYFKNF